MKIFLLLLIIFTLNSRGYSEAVTKSADGRSVTKQGITATEQFTPQPNLVLNPSFEGRGKWRTNWSWADLDAQMKIVSTDAVKGKRCLKVTCKRFVSGAVVWRSNNIKISKGKVYKLSFHYKGNKVSRLKVGLRMIGAPWKYYFSKNVTPLAQWEKAEIIGIAPKNDSSTAVFFFTRDEGTVWIDNVILEEVTLAKVASARFDNFIANSSFEVDNIDSWMVEKTKFIKPVWKIDTTSAFHGKKSLKIKKGRKRVINTTFFYTLKGRCDHIFSAYLRSDRTVKVKMLLRAKNGSSVFEKEFTVGKEWKRYSVSGNSMVSLNNCYYLSFEVQNAPLWIDAVSFTEGDKLKPYAPRKEIEAIVKIQGTPSKFFVEKKTVNAIIETVNYNWLKNKTASLTCDWELYDWYDQKEQSGKITSTPSTAVHKISIIPKKRGMYRLVVKLENGTSSEDIFAVVATPKTVINSPFGGHFSFNKMDIDIVKKVGIVQERTHWPPIYTQWEVLEKEKGNWDWSKLDKAVTLAKENNIKIYGSIAGTPNWAFPQGKKLDAAWNTYKVVFPKDISLWKNYVRKIVKRYPYITTWEIFNEPHVGIFFSGTDEELAKLFVIAAKTIKELNPQARISGFGDAPHATVNSHLSLLKNNDALQYLNAVTMHFYLYGNIDKSLDTVRSYVNRTRKFLDKNGGSHIEIWDTEHGPGITASFRKNYDNLGRKEKGIENVKWMIKNNTSKLSFGISKLFLYLINHVSQINHVMGHSVVDFDYAPTPALAAYAMTTHFLANTEPKGSLRGIKKKLRAYRFKRRGDKKNIVIAWSIKDGDALSIDKKLPVDTEVYDEMGNKVKENITVNNMPKYFIVNNADIEEFTKLFK